jgi:hypothetical protein
VLKSVPGSRISTRGVRIMSIIPLDLERRFEQRWAARFLRPLAAPTEKADHEEGMAVARAARGKSFRQAPLVPEQSAGLSRPPEGEGK